MKKTLISLAAAAVLAVGFSATAKAGPSFGFGFGLDSSGLSHFGVSVSDGYGYPAYGPGYYGAGYGGAGYGDSDCGFTWVNDWHRVHHHMVFGPHKVWSCE